MRVCFIGPGPGYVVFGIAKEAAVGVFLVLLGADPRRGIDGRRSLPIVDREHGRAKASLQLRLGFLAQPFELCRAVAPRCRPAWALRREDHERQAEEPEA